MNNSAKTQQATKAEVARLCQMGRFADALQMCVPLCSDKPDDPELWFLQGAIRGSLGDFHAAEACSRKALSLAPGQPTLYCNLGIALLRQDRPAEAREAFRNALNLRPSYAEGLTGLGDACYALGEFTEAVRYFRESLTVVGSQPQTLYNLAQATLKTGDHSRVDHYFEQATLLAPTIVEMWIAWSNYLLGQGNLTRATQILDKAIAQLPDSADLRYQYGFVRHQAGRYEQALESFDYCLRLDAHHRSALFARAMLLRQIGRLSDAAQNLLTILQINPADAQAHAGLAGLYKDEGRIEESLSHGHKAVELDPGNAEIHGNLVMDMHYSERITPSELFAAHQSWGLAHATELDNPVFKTASADPDRPLRIGYVSPDFREHSVAYFASPIVTHHDRTQHTVFCYSNLAPERADSMTEHLREHADVWRDIASLSDKNAVELIGADGIDVLVDLAGHTANNRLGIFALRAAPIQITWIGYPGTTGVPAMDYRLTDAIADPAPDSDRFCTEQLVRIPEGFLCYSPPDAPDPGPAPQEHNGFVTFGSFNNLAKVNDLLLVTWAAILKAIPNSRLVLKSIALADDAVRVRMHARLSALGVDAARIDLIPWQPTSASHLGHYRLIDVALDTYPYNGTTTTCEALWMGVPVISWRGQTHASRVGASLLGQIGLTDFVADAANQYIQLATSLALDADRLSELRKTLRDRLRHSTIMDSRAFCRRLEQTYRTAWRRWLRDQQAV